MHRFIISLTVFYALLMAPLTQAQNNDLRNPTALVDNSPYTGDLEGMVQRRIIRVLTVYGPGRYYLDNGAKALLRNMRTDWKKSSMTATRPVT